MGRAYAGLPTYLRLPALAVATLTVVTALGFGLTLPPGPLCDEGMWLFMEGGCDWGESNVFFHTKLGLLLLTNAVLVSTVLLRRVRLRGLLPHVGFLSVLAMLPSMADAGKCETYYGHPNGNLAQLVLEVAAFALLGLAVVGPLRRRAPTLRVAGLIALNALNIALFHGALLVTPHWTWLHTALLVASEVLLALAFTAMRPAPRGVRASQVLAVVGATSFLVSLRGGLEAPVNVLLAALVLIGAFVALRGLWRARV